MPDSTGPVLSYSVPQSVVTDGVSYIELQLRPTDWLVPTADPTATPAPPAPAGVRTITGNTFRPANTKIGVGGGVDPGDPPPSKTPRPVVLSCSITSPSDGVVITVPSSGVSPTIIGTAGVTVGADRVDTVLVSVNGATGTPAAPDKDGSWTAWTYVLPVTTTSAVYSITATAWNQAKTVSAQKSETFSVAVTPNPPVADTTPPVVTVAAPTAPVIADSGGNATITVSGVAFDPDNPAPQGLSVFTVQVDGQIVTGATPDASGNWSCSATVTGLGEHDVSVTATNTSGLTSISTARVEVASAAPTPPVIQRLLIAERLRLSTFLTAYGVGDPIKTVTMMPNESTQFSIQTFESTTVSATQAESILETNSETASQDFQNTVDDEQTDKSSSDESKKWHVDASVSASWGVAKASIDGGLAGSTNAAREQVSKSVVGAVNKHAAEKSSQRTANASTSREATQTDSTTTSTQSTIANINQSCTLNIVISQMIKQFTTVLHLVDVRLAYVRADNPATPTAQDGTPNPLVWTYNEVTLAQLDGFLDSLIVTDRADAVRSSLLEVLSNVFDYTGTQRTMVEERQLMDSTNTPISNGSYLRVPPQTSTLADGSLPGPVTVDGVILGVTQNTMRTSSLVSDVVKGAGSGLDGYNTALQSLALDEKRLANAQLQSALDKEQIAATLITNANAAGATIYGEVFPPPTVVPEGWTIMPATNGAGGS